MIENTREIYESLYPRIFNQHYGMCSEEFNRPFDYFEGYDYLISIIEEKNKEIERLNNIINEFNNAYSKVITKCNQMINSRYYMNEIAIKKYGEEIKDICYYYVGEAKEIRGVDKE